MPTLARRDRVFLNNPVLIQGLGLAPIIVAATTLNNAVVLAVAVILLLVPTRVISSVLSRFCNPRFRGVLYTVTAGVLFIGVGLLLSLIFGMARLRLLGLYLPLLIMEPMIIRRYVRPKRERISIALSKGISTTLGFLIILFLVAACRELLAFGTLFGITVLNFAPLPFAGMVAGGFVVVGLLAALWTSCINIFKKRVSMGVKQG
ncbi:MAG: Rnf-Nqr domain containing protein, partial [Oscillospiraceae bacterium]